MAGDALMQVLSALAAARAEVYSLLSLGLYAPDEEFVAELWSGKFAFELQRALQASQAPIAPDDIQTLERKGDWPTLCVLSEALRVEYTRLFVGPHALPAPPYESVYREPSWGVMGETTLDVRHTYWAAGFTLDPEVRELPDHVAVELEFLAWLSNEQAAAWSIEDEATALRWLRREHTFLERHLGRWIPAFAEQVSATATNPLYSSLARIASAFVTHAQGQMVAIARVWGGVLEVKGTDGREFGV